jgi:hypothetical protein
LIGRALSSLVIPAQAGIQWRQHADFARALKECSLQCNDRILPLLDPGLRRDDVQKKSAFHRKRTA